MVNGLHLYRAFYRPTVQYCLTFTNSATHSHPTAESTMQGDSQLVRCLTQGKLDTQLGGARD